MIATLQGSISILRESSFMMKKLLHGSVALLALVAMGPAMAADMRVKAPLRAPPVAAFNWSIESFGLTEALLKADLEAQAKAGDYNDQYYDEFKKVAVPIARQRLEQGAQRLASLWTQAYEEAGKPDVSRLSY